jgi:hypothetical protein
MSRVTAPIDPIRRRAYRSFKSATEFGVHDQTSGAIDGPHSASEALARRQDVTAAGKPASVVARYTSPSGTLAWFDVTGSQVSSPERKSA